MKSSSTPAIKFLFYFGGLLMMTLGISVSVKSGLGVTPISSIPYTMTIVFGIELGIATAIFSIIAALLEIPILRSKYKMKNLLQIPISIVFGLFMSGCSRLVQTFPAPEAFFVKFILMLLSTAIVAIGVFVYVSSGLIPLPTEGFLLAITEVTPFKFSSLKLIGDISMVIISLTACLTAVHQLGSIGIGTIVSAVLVGNEVKILSKLFGEKLKNLIGKGSKT